MRRIIIMFFILLSPSIFWGKNVGAGIELGNISGISLKYENDDMIKNNNSINSLISWRTEGDSKLSIFGDWTFNKTYIKERKDDILNLPYYYGIGSGLIFDDGVEIAVRLPLGLKYIFQEENIEVFFEITPALKLLKGSEAELYIGAGARYLFKI
ncbi:MAG: hypothetical protein KA059_03435 [Elusimicrobiales bacterium]|nr:hypothetical protein [Elusimicrobiales bacterium]